MEDTNIKLRIRLLLLVSLFCYTISAQNNSCPSECKSLSHYDCTICYQSCPSANDQSSDSTDSSIDYTFQMQSCKLTYCADWALRKYRNCASFKQRDLDQQECIKQCCNQAQYSKFTNQTYNQCVYENDDLHSKLLTIGMIVGIVIGSIIVIVLLAIFIIFCKCADRSKGKKICQKCPCFKSNNKHENQPGQVFGIQNNPAQIAIQPIPNQFNQIQNLKWTQIQQNMKQSISDHCSICLDSNMNCQTACGHKFHFLCFKQWIRKNPACPLCINHEFNDIRIICQKCHLKQATFHIEPNFDQSQNFLNGNIINCDRCICLENQTNSTFVKH